MSRRRLQPVDARSSSGRQSTCDVFIVDASHLYSLRAAAASPPVSANDTVLIYHWAGRGRAPQGTTARASSAWRHAASPADHYLCRWRYLRQLLLLRLLLMLRASAAVKTHQPLIPDASRSRTAHCAATCSASVLDLVLP